MLLWHESLEVQVIDKSQRFIHVHVRENTHEPFYRITFMYGEPRVADRPMMWDTLRGLRGVLDRPWLVMGDFNEASWGYEHFLACPRPETQMDNFRDALADCDLTDIGFSSLPFTYDNGRAGVANVKVCLDVQWQIQPGETLLVTLAFTIWSPQAVINALYFWKSGRKIGRGIKLASSGMKSCGRDWNH